MIKKAKIPTTISTETIIHNEIKELLQTLWRTHQIRVNNISASWLNISTYNQPDQLVSTINIDTTTF